MSELRQVIVELLGQLGSSREAREYLRRFSSVDSYQFAIVKVGGGVLAEQLNELVSALAFLRHVGLLPIVLHGAGPQLNDALAKAGLPVKVVDGMRVTTPEVMEVVRPVVYQENHRLAAALERAGVPARSLLHGVFESDYLQPDRYGLVGDVTRVHSATLKSAVEAGAVPVVACLGESRSGQVLNINADVAARALVLEVQPHKVVFLTPTGGLLDQTGRVISAINLATDYDDLMTQDWVHSGMRLKLVQLKYLLDRLPATASVSITSASNLTHELFTHRGRGTLVRSGENFLVETELGDGDREKLGQLLETCFKRRLDGDYLADLQNMTVVRSESWRAAAVILSGCDGIAYMDKFAVTGPAQGEGLGATLWQQVKAQFPNIYWRSRLRNPINEWYGRKSQICVRSGMWRVYAKGVGLEQMQACVEDATIRSSSWLEDVAA